MRVRLQSVTKQHITSSTDIFIVTRSEQKRCLASNSTIGKRDGLFLCILHGSGTVPFLGSGNQQNNTHQSVYRFVFICFYDFRVREVYIFRMEVYCSC